MALIVETGTGSALAESYASIATINAYAIARGLTFAIADADAPIAEAAARRATVWLDATYLGRLTGRKTNGRSQALQWPRIGAYDQQCPAEYLQSDEIPAEIIAACCESAIREKAAPGALSPDVTPGKIKKRVKIEGAVEVEYAVGSAGSAGQRPVVAVIDDILASLLGPRPSSLFGKAVRA